MFDELNERLAAIKNQLHKRKKWKEQLADYETELQEQQQTATELKAKMEENQEDIEKLEEFSFLHLLAILTSSTDKRIQHKRKEITNTKLKYDESQHALSHIENAIKDLKQKLHALPDIDQAYQTILNEKTQLIEDANSPLTKRYDELSENIADLQSFLTEASEAIRAGEEVVSSLTEAVDKLKKSKEWGGFDMFGGGGFATYKKHHHLDDAKASIHAAQMKMRMLQKELLDIHHEINLDIDISGMLTFADFFFDGIFIDYIVQGEIEDALKKTEEQRRETNKIVFQLHFRYDRKEKEFHQLENKKQTMLENA